MESILTSIKQLIGVHEEDENFDTAIIMHINTAFMSLTQMGIGPKEGFSISDKTSLWSDFIPEDMDMLKVEGVKTYVYIQVKMVFDPSGSGSVNEALKRKSDELEWRLTNHL